MAGSRPCIPRIFAGLLAEREKPEHLATLDEHGIGRIDLAVVNLYPFRETAARPGATAEEIVEMIDIGGPSMVRAAAKNFAGVAVLVDPGDYATVLAELRDGAGVLSTERLRALAAKAFAHTASYDAAVASLVRGNRAGGRQAFPARLTLRLERELVPRYGENPHQRAAVYRAADRGGVLGGIRQVQGKELSWNNLLDADAARKLMSLFAEPSVVILKHNNPCGVGRGADLEQAYRRALACDPVSAFGSIVAMNRRLELPVVEAMRDLFVEVVMAPEASEEALAALAGRKNLRLLLGAGYPPNDGIELRNVDGGFLAQEADGLPDPVAEWTCPTRRAPEAEERRALEFAWSSPATSSRTPSSSPTRIRRSVSAPDR